MKIATWRCAPFVMAWLLAGCGGGSPSSLGPSSQQSAPVQTQTARVNFRILLPSATSTSAGRSPAFVSPSTRSASVSVTPSSGSASTPTVVNCTTACSGQIAAPPGADTFLVKLYDAPNAAGNVLSTASLAQTIVLNGANVMNMTANGVVATLSLAVGAATAGTPGTIAVTVNALDADGNTIVGPGYVNAAGSPLTVTLADSDTSGATALSQATVTQSTSGITLSYTGLAIVPATITAGATGLTNRTSQFAPVPNPIVVATSDTQNPSFAGVDFYATSGMGSSGSFTVSEVGWTNSPYNKTLTVTPGGGCANIGSTAQSGNTFTAGVAVSPAPGTCTALTLSDGVGQSQDVTLAYSNFAYTGAAQSVTVPAGVTQMSVVVAGALGGAGNNQGNGGYAGGAGGSVTAQLPVAAGTLTVDVGQAGSTGGAATFGGGGSYGTGFTVSVEGASGGGASSIIEGGSTLLVAGGGGAGGGGAPGAGSLGGAGGQSGQNGLNGTGGCSTNSTGGTGATASAFGIGGIAGTGCGTSYVGANGSLGTGGAGGNGAGGGGGGAGGGYYGGGGGGGSAGAGGGGGGGSSFVANPIGTPTYITGTQNGNGQVIISW
jgi:hypothetical protein